jgi:HEAT repeat protein
MTKWNVLAAIVISFAILFGIERVRNPGFDARDPDPAIRAAAVKEVWRNGERDGVLLESLKDEDPDVRLLAVTALQGACSDPEKRIGALIPLLRESSGPIRRKTIWCLASFNLDPPLIAALGDQDPLVRSGLLDALADTSLWNTKRGRSPGRLKDSIQTFAKIARDDPDADVRKLAEELRTEIISAGQTQK